MKTANDNPSKKSFLKNRHPIRQKLLSELLCICLLLVSLPMECYSSEVQAAEPQKQILSFSDLSQEIKYQTLETGTPLENLNLPKTLEAVCIPLENEPSVQPENGLEGQGTASEQEKLPESPEPLSEVPAPNSPEPAQESTALNSSELAQESLALNSELDTANTPETIPDSSGSEPGTADTPGAVNGPSEEEPDTADTPGAVNSSSGSEPNTADTPGAVNGSSESEPNTTDTPGAVNGSSESESNTADTPGTVPVSSEEEPNTANPPEPEPEPDALPEENVMIEHVTWISAPSYDPETEGTYLFTPVLPEQYVPAENVSLPEIQVTVTNTENPQGEREQPEPTVPGRRTKSRTMEETEKIRDSGEEPKGQDSLISPASEDTVITQDTSWGKKTLSGGNLVVAEGVTLTLNDVLTINGNVTIRGKGTIARGSANARIDIFSSLTLQEITLDGKGLKAPYAMVMVRKTLKMEAGCKIQNCHTRGNPAHGSVSGYGGAVYLFWYTYAKAELLDCTISNCTASAGGAAYCSQHCSLTLDKGCRIENCRAVKGDGADNASGCGGAVDSYLYSATVKLLNCTISNCSSDGNGGAVNANNMTLILGSGCKIENCSAKGNGGAVSIWQATTDFQDFTITNCSANWGGGAIYCGDSTLELNQNCKIQKCSAATGGAFYNHASKLYINAGEFSENTAANSGGAIFHSNTAETQTFLTGGTFQGNSCTSEKYAGSGGACLSSEGTAAYDTHFELSGDVNFCGGESGADGIYLDSRNAAPRKIILSQTLTHPLTVYLEAAEHYVIAKGTESYKLTEEDRKKISFSDVGESGKYWTLKLDEAENEIYLTEIEYKTVFADFYSGGPEPQEPVCEEMNVEKSAIEGTMKAPSLKNFSDWEPLGWNESPTKYTADIGTDGICILAETARKYYGIYQREVTLSYDAGNEAQGPAPESQFCYANVHENEIGYQKAAFIIKEGPARENYDFLGWSISQEEGQISLYQPDDILDIKDDTTLYAVYRKREMRTFLAKFHSGDPVQIQTELASEEETATEGTITAPLLENFSDWAPLGWSISKTGHDVSLLAQGTCTLREPLTEYYGIYGKNITLTYDPNGGETAPEPETKPAYANVHQEVTRELPEFTFAKAIHRDGYAFVGWNTAPDGSGTFCEIGAPKTLEQDTLLYAIWQEVPAGPETAPYRVEHYCQTLTGEDYVKMDNDTEHLTGTTDTEAEAQPKTYTGFTVNLSHPSGKSKGTIEADGSLVLKLFYDRNVYQVDFDLNGGYGTPPSPQKIRYGGLLEKVSDPFRAGYNFKGWYLEENGLADNLWDFDSPVENNTGNLHVTLYAGWADELAPSLGETSFSKSHENFLNWKLQKQSLVITVPVTEEGSGLANAEYLLMSEDGTEKDGKAQFWETHALADTMAPYGTSATLIRGALKQAERGKYQVQFAIEEEFKGTVSLTCTDHAGNISAQKTLTAKGGGIIIEDNGPEIHFSNTKETSGGKPLEVKITVKDNMEGHVTGGISQIRYTLDKKKKKTLPKEEFSKDFVEEYHFTIKIRGEGTHTLQVKAADHAGNETTAKITLKINGTKNEPAEIPDPPTPKSPEKPVLPLGSEPKTGEFLHIQVYATITMIAGFTYLLLYFQGENGITEQEKEEIIYRLVSWAKQGGRIRRILGLAVIFLFLAYYHSIGKSVSVEWKEVRVK